MFEKIKQKIKEKILKSYIYKLPIYQICFEIDALKKVKPNLFIFFKILCEEGEYKQGKNKFYIQNKVLYLETDEEIIEIPTLKELEKILEKIKKN